MMRLNGTSYYIDCVAARLPRSSDAEVSFRLYGSINEKLLYEPAMTHHHSILMLLMPLNLGQLKQKQSWRVTYWMKMDQKYHSYRLSQQVPDERKSQIRTETKQNKIVKLKGDLNLHS